MTQNENARRDLLQDMVKLSVHDETGQANKKYKLTPSVDEEMDAVFNASTVSDPKPDKSHASQGRVLLKFKCGARLVLAEKLNQEDCKNS